MLLRETITTYQALALCGMSIGWGLIIGRDDDSTITWIGRVIVMISVVILWMLM